MNRGAPRILILSSGPACRNPRPLKEACALQAAGCSVTLMARAFNPHNQALDEHLAHEGGFHRHFIPEDSSLATRGGTWLARRLCAAGIGRIQALGQHRRLLEAAERHPADLTIVHTEIPFWIGLRLLRQGRRVAADIEDWHSEDLLPAARRYRPLRLLRRLERDLLHKASYCSTTSGVLSTALQQRYEGQAAEVITNSFTLQPEPDLSQRQGPPALFWYSQTLGPGRGLEPFLKAWAEDASESRLVLLGEPVQGYPDRLRSLLPPSKRQRLEFRGLVPPSELPGLIATHDVGLALEEPTPESRRLTITNKILQYLNAGLAVIASDTEGQKEVFARSPGIGALIRLDSPDTMREAIRGLLHSRETLREAQTQARSLARGHYNWEREAIRLQALVSQALARQPASPSRLPV